MFQKTWHIAETTSLSTCGCCRTGFLEGEPYQTVEVAPGVFRDRCQAHAIGGVDDEAIAQAEREREARKAPAAPVDRETNEPTPTTSFVRSFASLADHFDGKAAAAGRDDA